MPASPEPPDTPSPSDPPPSAGRPASEAAPAAPLSHVLPPAAAPCRTCPYRRDVPSGVWDASEYDRLERYDRDLGEQPQGVFMCHQRDNRLCAGWVGCHGAENLLGLRLAHLFGMTDETLAATMAYVSRFVPLFRSGAAAAAHGRRDIDNPGPAAIAAIESLTEKLTVHRRPERP